MPSGTEPSHTLRKAISRYELETATLPRAYLSSLAGLVGEISSEVRVEKMREIKTYKEELIEDLDEDNRGWLAVCEEVAEHALLPVFEVVGDQGTVEVTSHDITLFDQGTVLPTKIESVTMEFGVSGAGGESFVEDIESTKMPYMGQLRTAGKVKVTIANKGREPVVTALAFSEDETWTRGVVNRIERMLSSARSKRRFIHRRTFLYGVQSFSLLVLVVGAWLLFHRLNFEALPRKDFPLPLVITLLLALGLAAFLGFQLTKYVRWLFPRLEIDPVPAEARSRHKRAIALFAFSIFLPIVVDAIWALVSRGL